MSFLPNNSQNNYFQTPISLNDFQTLLVLSQGKYGSVYKVKYKKTGKIFALKAINQKYFTSKEREKIEIDFMREKEILYDLTAKNYIHVIKLYSDFQDMDNRYLVMEMVEGTYLNELKGNQENGYLDQKLVINILVQLLETLVYLHDNCHIIHRNITPDNIILEKNGNIKLLDFGFSAYLVHQNRQLVSNRSLKGKLFFAPDEIVLSPIPLNYDYKIDVFSLGFTIFSLMNPSKDKKYNLPQITVGKYSVDLRRYDNNIINNFYDPWLIQFVSQLYEKNKEKRPTAKNALNLLNELLLKHYPNDYMKINKRNIDPNNINSINVLFSRQNYEQANNNIIINNTNKIKELESKINNLQSELFNERKKNNDLIIENNNLKQQIFQLKIQLQNNLQNIQNIRNNNYDQLINLLKQKEEQIKDLQERIKRYPFILEKNENLISVIFYSLDQKVHYPMICKNTDTIHKLEEKLYAEYPNLSERENYFLCKGTVLNKFQTFEKSKIKNGDIIILNQNNSTIVSK